MQDGLSFNITTFLFSIFNLLILFLILSAGIYVFVDCYRRTKRVGKSLLWGVGSTMLFPLVILVYFYYRKKNEL